MFFLLLWPQILTNHFSDLLKICRSKDFGVLKLRKGRLGYCKQQIPCIFCIFLSGATLPTILRVYSLEIRDALTFLLFLKYAF